MKQNITKMLCMYLAEYMLLTALLVLELAEQEILKHMHSNQYQFGLFHIIPEVLFRHSRDVFTS